MHTNPIPIIERNEDDIISELLNLNYQNDDEIISLFNNDDDECPFFLRFQGF